MDKARYKQILEEQEKIRIEELKDWLKAYQQNEMVINEKLEKLRTVYASATSVSAQEITDMPRAPSNPKDRMADWLVRVDSLERSLELDIAAQEASKKAIEDLIASLESLKMQKIIRCRYLYGMEWSEVIAEMYREKPDYAAKIRAYERRTYRDHERALKLMVREWWKKPKKERAGGVK